jgi:dTDP-4-dehydrorhamnose reductase
VDRILVAGINTVVGSNVAESISAQHRVTGISFDSPIELPTCDVEAEPARKTAAIAEVLGKVKPKRIVFCGVAAESCWDERFRPQQSDLDLAKLWIDAAKVVDCQLTIVSSDAVFTGPWMFHAENSGALCPSNEAGLLQKIEQYAIETSADTLIVRTHALGWRAGCEAGWLESLLGDVESGVIGSVDFARHGTPLLATDLAEILKRCWESGLVGIHHAAGAERISPRKFALRLAAHFRLPTPASPIAGCLADKTVGYGCGETSLQTRKIRRALGIPMPLLDESLERLYQQHVNGYRLRLSAHAPVSRVA